MHYFGTDSAAALAKYLDQRDDLQVNRTPRVQGDGLRTYFGCYNTERPHQSLDYRTPAEVYGVGAKTA